MRKRLILLVVLLFGFSSFANATPVTFDVDGGTDSYVNLSNIDSILGSTTISATLNSELATMGDFTLIDDQSTDLDFFTFDVDGTGLGSFDIEANLSFYSPDIDTYSTGDGGWGTIETFFGTLSGGIFSWENSSHTYTLADGNVVQIALEDGFALGCGDSVIVHATVTNLGGAAPVPEPATLLLLGSGLAGLAFYRRKRK